MTSRTSRTSPSSTPSTGQADTAEPSPAWWRLPIVWMVIAGPALVVVASFVTLALAILNPDPVLDTSGATKRSELPAVQARNHAATPQR